MLSPPSAILLSVAHASPCPTDLDTLACGGPPGQTCSELMYQDVPPFFGCRRGRLVPRPAIARCMAARCSMIFLLVGCRVDSPAERADSNVAELLSLIRAHSLDRDRVDWEGFTQDLRVARAQHLVSPSDAAAAAFALLEDEHSTYRSAEGDVVQWQRPGEAARIGRSGLPTVQRVGMGVLVDLRSLKGGSTYRFLDAVCPYLPSRSAGSFVDAYGQIQEVTPDCERAAPMPRAILIDGATASAAEHVALAFHGQPDVRYFGENSAGLSTGTALFHLSDGGLLNLTGSTFVGPDGTSLDHNGLRPDVSTLTPVEDAIAWLTSRR